MLYDENQINWRYWTEKSIPFMNEIFRFKVVLSQLLSLLSHVSEAPNMG